MSTRDSALSDLLFGQIRGRILALLYGWHDKAFYVRQIARHVDASAGSVRRELEKLAAVDLLVKTSLGNQVFYRANQANPVFAEMRTLVNKTVGIFHVLRSALEKISGQITVAFVYGSIARQTETAESDVDLLIIGAAVLDDVLACLPHAETALGRAINPTVYSMAEFTQKLNQGNHFLSAVVKGPKVFLIGGEDELGKMAGIRMGKARAQQRKRNQSVRGHRRAKSG